MTIFLGIFEIFIDFKKNARTSLPGGNQVDGLPPASSNAGALGASCQNLGNGRGGKNDLLELKI